MVAGVLWFRKQRGRRIIRVRCATRRSVSDSHVPFIPMDPKEAVQIANSFDELREFIGTPFKET
jgi:hypothetical protein